MYCPKCGTKLNDGSYNCTNCDWTWEEFEEGSTTLDEKKESNPVEAKKGTEGKILINNNFPKLNNFKKTFDFANLNSKKTKAIGIVGLVLVVSIIIGALVYRNSDSYKIGKASNLIVEGKYSEGINEIYDLYTPQAVTIKNFVEIEDAKQAFLNSAVSDDLDKTWEAYEKFKTTLNEFSEKNDVYYLPEQLRPFFDCYKFSFDYVSEYIESTDDEAGDMVNALYDVQSVMMNEVYKNKSSEDGEIYTLKQLQNRVDESKSALEILKNFNFSEIEITDTNVVAHCCTSTLYLGNSRTSASIKNSVLLLDTIDALIYHCEYEIESSQKSINESLKKFELNDELYKVRPVEGFTQYVGENLEEISTYADISTNQGIILKILRRDMLYYLLVGSAVE